MPFCRVAAAARIALLLISLALACQARSDPTPMEMLEPVRVTGVRAIAWKSYRAMRAAMDAYAAHRDMAPNARFAFGAILPPGRELPLNFAMRVRAAGGKEYPIEMTGNRFQLPILPGDMRDADLVTNLKGVSIKVGVEVHTRDLPRGMDRLGDLRLYCEVMRAIDRVDESLLERLLLPDSCHSRGALRWFSAPLNQATMGAFLVEADRKTPLTSRVDADGTYYGVPLSDTSWSDDALVSYDYLEPYPANRDKGRLRFTEKN